MVFYRDRDCLHKFNEAELEIRACISACTRMVEREEEDAGCKAERRLFICPGKYLQHLCPALDEDHVV